MQSFGMKRRNANRKRFLKVRGRRLASAITTTIPTKTKFPQRVRILLAGHGQQADVLCGFNEFVRGGGA